MSGARIELAEVIRQLRAELRGLSIAADSEAIVFQVGSVELTATVEVTREVGAAAELGGRIRFWVFDANAKTKGQTRRAGVTTQTIKMTLTPATMVEPSAQTLEPRQIHIRGRAVPGEAQASAVSESGR